MRASATSGVAGARALRIVARAREEVTTGVVYDRTYVSHGSGRPDRERGACTDLVVRALAAGGVDLQSAIFNDALRAPSAYANIALVDGRIDHRRAPNQHVWLSRHARKLPVSLGARETFAAGDIVVWTYGTCPECKADHVGVVSDRLGKRGYPLILHNAGPRATEEDALDAWPLIGHYRVVDDDRSLEGTPVTPSRNDGP